MAVAKRKSPPKQASVPAPDVEVAREISDRYRARKQARRETANHHRRELLENYRAKLRELDTLCAQVHPDDVENGRADLDPLSAGWSQDGEPLRAAIEHELAIVSAALDQYPRAAAGMSLLPTSADDLRATEAAILVTERGWTEYEATAGVYRVAPADIANSPYRARVRRAAGPRKRKPAR